MLAHFEQMLFQSMSLQPVCWIAGVVVFIVIQLIAFLFVGCDSFSVHGSGGFLSGAELFAVSH